MNPKINNIIEESGVYYFTLSNINVSLANALRRIILSEIPTLTFNTEKYSENECIIEVNTSRLHNEIIRQRLGCIPIHEKVIINNGKMTDSLSGKYILEVDVSNDTDNIIYVTSEHFKIKNKENNNYLTLEETHKIFPKNSITQYYIDFVRLRPKISDSIPGEKIKLTCEFSVNTAKTNSMYNVVSKCTYSYSPDIVKQKSVWENIQNKLDSDISKEEIMFQKRNFELLDAQRYYIENSFDFAIQTVGPYENKEIVKMGCMVLQHKFIDLIKEIDSDTINIIRSETTIDNCYDIMLENEDYTIGKVLEYILYEIYYQKEKRLSFCGFKKYHPHDTYSIIRIAFKNNGEKSDVRQCLRKACIDAQDIFTTLYKMF